MSKGKILVIDDSPIVRKLAEMALADEGYEVFTAENGEDGLRLAEEITPAVILVDFIMPRMSGYQFCQLVRESAQLKETPIILITAKGDDVGRKFSERFSVSDYFIKPFKSEALVDKVNAIVLGQDAEVRKYEPPAQSFDAGSEVAIPFGGFDAEPAAPSTAGVSAGESPFAFSFDQDVDAPAIEPVAAADTFSFDSPDSPVAFDVPSSFDTSAFELPASEESVPEAIDLVEPVEIAHHEPAEAAPSFELPSAFQYESSHESPLLDEVSLASQSAYEETSSLADEPVFEPAPLPEPEPEPVSEQETAEPVSALASAAALSAAAAAAFAAPAVATAAVEPSAAAQPAAMSREVVQYIESSLPLIVQKSVDNILKQSGIVRDPSALLSGDLGVFDICDVLRLLRSAKVTGKLFVHLQNLSADIYFDAGKAVAVSVGSADGEKKGFGVSAEAGPVQMKALLADTVAKIMKSPAGTFSVVREALSSEMLAAPMRVGPVEIIEQALMQVPTSLFAECGDAGAVVVRIIDAAALGMLSLDEVDRRVLSVIDGPRQIDDVLSAVGGDAAAVRKSIYGLVKLGVLAELG